MAGGEHAAEELREVLETRERRADADAEIVVDGRALGGPLALHAATASVVVETFSERGLMRL